MSLRTGSRTRFGFVRQYPTDLALASGVSVLAYAAVTSLEPGSAARLIAAFPLILFLPGYALVSVLFPARERDARVATGERLRPRGIDVTERLGLSLGVSLALVPLLVLALPSTPWGLDATSVAAGLAVGTVSLAQLGAVRRLRTPEEKRFVVSPLLSFDRFRSDETGSISFSSILLAVAVALAVGSLVVAFFAPVSAGGFTELGLYTESDDGDLVAGDLPSEVAPAESVPLTVEIENHEGEDIDYTVVVQQERVEDGEVVERTELEQREASVSAGDAETDEYQVEPTASAGETVRVSVLLYDDEPSAEPDADDALEDTHFWVTVTDEE